LELLIEKLIYGGDGLARLPADAHGRGKAAFLPFVLANERVDARLIEEKPGFARAALDHILEASLERVQPGCPYFTRCGGCHYQHSNYGHQLEIKASILKENLRRTAKLELEPELQLHRSPAWNYRNRTRLRLRTAPEFAIGYNRFGSHELEPVKECPISSPLINRAIASIWNLGRENGIDESIRELELFASSDDSQLLIEAYVHGGTAKARAEALSRALLSGVSGAAGVGVFRKSESHSKPEADQNLFATAGAATLEYETASAKYRVSAGAFFQTNRHLTDELLAIVTAGRSGGTVFDLYAGVGLFSGVLARTFERVVAVEASPKSFADLEYNSPGNVNVVEAAVETFLSGNVGRKYKPDLIVVDPPRGGLGTKVAEQIASFRAPELTYVSCDPATLARDLVPWLAAGYRVQHAHLLDLFPQTFHIESVLHLARH
jgi:23S rRNA (uracil1939-C5)-methyltransferase